MSITTHYHTSQYLHYPEQKKLIHHVLRKPTADLSFDPKKMGIKSSGFFHQIAYIFQAAMHRLKMCLCSCYKIKFNAAVTKIESTLTVAENPQGVAPLSPAALGPTHSTQPTHSHKVAALQGIAQEMNSDMSEVWEKLFSKFEEDVVQGWSCRDGKFEIKLKKPLKLWVPSKNNEGIEDPIGGVILLFGSQNHLIKGTMNKKEMNFDKGSFSVYCEYKIPLPFFGVRYIQPDVFKLKYESREKVGFVAGITIAGHKLGREREKSIPNLLENWGTIGIVVGDNHHDFLVKKIIEAKQPRTATGQMPIETALTAFAQIPLKSSN